MSEKYLILCCDACLARNRVPAEKLRDHPVCGKCRLPLSSKGFGSVLEVTDRSFDVQVLKSETPVLVDCWAPWCGPCRGFAPVLESIAVKYGTRLKVAKLNVDENTTISSRYRIQSVPTILMVKNGRIVEQMAGAFPKDQLEAKIDYFLG